MSTNYTPAPKAHPVVRLPSDGDLRSASVIVSALQKVADNARYALGVFAKNLRPHALPLDAGVRPYRVHAVASGERNTFRALCAVGYDFTSGLPAIYLSSDGETWSPVSKPATTGKLYGVAFSDTAKRWVAVGESFGGEASICRTSDSFATAWAPVSSLVDGRLNAVCVSPAGVCVAVGVRGYDGAAFVFRSEDTVTWAEVEIPLTGELRSVVFADGVFVAVGGDTSPLVVRSTDGLTWTQEAAPNAYRLDGVAYNGRVFAAKDIGGRVITSADGIGWALRALLVPDGAHVACVAADPDAGVLLFAGDAKQGLLASFDDGATLEPGYTIASTLDAYLPLDIYGLSFGAGRFFAGCSGGHIAVGLRR